MTGLGGSENRKQPGVAFWTTVALCFAVTWAPASARPQPAAESDAIEQIALLGGIVERDEQLPGRPVTSIRLNREQVSDEDLHCLLYHR